MRIKILTITRYNIRVRIGVATSNRTDTALSREIANLKMKQSLKKFLSIYEYEKKVSVEEDWRMFLQGISKNMVLIQCILETTCLFDIFPNELAILRRNDRL